MPRPERPLNPAGGPVAGFARDLRELRERAGSPGYRQMAQRAHFSASALSKAANGEQPPSLDVTLAYVAACDGDVESWRARWHDLKRELSPPRPAPVVPGPTPRRRRRRWLAAAVAGAVLVIVVLAASVLPGGDRGAVPPHRALATGAGLACANGRVDRSDAPVPSASYPVRRHEVYALCPGYLDDLDLDATTPDWRAGSTPGSEDYDLEFTLARRTLVGNQDAVIAVIDHPTHTYSDCGTATAYGVDLEPDDMTPGTEVCVITNERRRTLVLVEDVRRDAQGRPDRLVLDITTWDHVIDPAS